MRRTFACLLCALFLLGIGCSSGDTPASEQLTVWYIQTEAGQNSGDLLGSEQRPLAEGETALSAAAAALTETPRSGELARILPEDVTLLSCRLRGTTAQVNFSGGFGALTGVEQTVVQACAVLNLCALPEVESVSVSVEGEMVAAELDKTDIVLANTDPNPYNKRVKLYFPRIDGSGLALEERSFTLAAEEKLPERVVREFLGGPNDPELVPAAPEGTQLLSVSMEGKICLVDLSGDFLQAEAAEVGALVNTLTTLTNVQSVQILIDGRRVAALYDPLEFDPNYLAP